MQRRHTVLCCGMRESESATAQHTRSAALSGAKGRATRRQACVKRSGATRSGAQPLQRPRRDPAAAPLRCFCPRPKPEAAERVMRRMRPAVASRHAARAVARAAARLVRCAATHVVCAVDRFAAVEQRTHARRVALHHRLVQRRRHSAHAERKGAALAGRIMKGSRPLTIVEGSGRGVHTRSAPSSPRSRCSSMR